MSTPHPDYPQGQELPEPNVPKRQSDEQPVQGGRSKLVSRLALILGLGGAVAGAGYELVRMNGKLDGANEENAALKIQANTEKDRALKAEAGLLTLSNPGEFAELSPRFKENAEPLRNFVSKDIATIEDYDAKEVYAKRQAKAAVGLIAVGKGEDVWPMLQFSADPRVRSYLIHYFAKYDIDPQLLVQQIGKHDGDARITQALVLSLGEYSDNRIPEKERHTISEQLVSAYASNPDAGLHASVDWILRKWGQKEFHSKFLELANQRSIKSVPANGTSPTWYHTEAIPENPMIYFKGPTNVKMGSPQSEAGHMKDESKQHTRTIPRSFAVSSKAVTIKDFRKLQTPEEIKAHKLQPQYYVDSSDDSSCPIMNIKWHQAAEYCNRLSQKEGIPESEWCYEIKDGVVVRMKENYLNLRGYRLPTEAELEYSIRGGAETSRFYGESDEELLVKYGWYDKNSGSRAHPVGELKPNEYGVFDAVGNAMVWSNSRYSVDYNTSGVDREEKLAVSKDDRFTMRGGWHINKASTLRSAYRHGGPPDDQDAQRTMRLARTIREE